MVETDI